MGKTKTVTLLFRKAGCRVRVPASADVLTGKGATPIADPRGAVIAAIADPIGSPPLADLLADKKPRTVAITISDITRPVPNKVFLSSILDVLNGCGIADSQIVLIIGTGMHRPSTPQERDVLVGGEIARRLEVIDHTADRPETLTQVLEATADHPPVRVNRRFAEADFRIVTGFVEPHVMAGFSGGRKGVCPALVDLDTIRQFHGYKVLSHPAADNGILAGNPCHDEALRVAQAVGVDFLFNVGTTLQGEIAGIYCGDLRQAHDAGCRAVAEWTSAKVGEPYDLVITNGGGYPLEQALYQAIKGQCAALPAIKAGGVLLQIVHCGEQIGSPAYTRLRLRWCNDWQGFLAHIAADDRTELDQWAFQMQCRLLQRVGIEGFWLACDGIPPEIQQQLALTPVLGDGDAPTRLQRAVDRYVAANPNARIAVLPEGPYTLLTSRA